MASWYELSEVQWEPIRDFLPGRKQHVGAHGDALMFLILRSFPIPYVESDLRSSLRLIQVAKQRRLHRLRAEALWAKPKLQSAKHGGAKPGG
jgi:hypothetical protein